MTTIFWQEFGILFAATIIGSAALLPYSLRLIQGKPLKYSIPKLLLLSMLQNVVLFGVVVALGLLAAHAIGLGAPYIEAMLGGASISYGRGLAIALGLGLSVGASLP